MASPPPIAVIGRGGTTTTHKIAAGCRYAVSGGVPRRALTVALVVGTILNLINQGDALVTGGPVDLPKLLLNYVVPYCVSTYGAVSYRFHLARRLAGGDIERPS
jgi:hypothetical protein